MRQLDVSRVPEGLLLSFFTNTVLSSRSEDVHQMYSRGSVVGEATIRDLEISPTPRLIFAGGEQKVPNLASLSTSLDFVRPAFENAAR